MFKFLHEGSLDIILISNIGADQTAQMRRIICVSVVRMQQSNCLATTYAHLKQCPLDKLTRQFLEYANFIDGFCQLVSA